MYQKFDEEDKVLQPYTRPPEVGSRFLRLRISITAMQMPRMGNRDMHKRETGGTTLARYGIGRYDTLIRIVSSVNAISTDTKPFSQIAIRNALLDACLNSRLMAIRSMPKPTTGIATRQNRMTDRGSIHFSGEVDII